MNRALARLLQLSILIAVLAMPLSCGSPAGPAPGQTPAATVPQPAASPSSAVGTAAVPTPPSQTSPEATGNAPTPPTEPAAALVNGQPIGLHEYENQVALAVSYLVKQDNFDPTTAEGKETVAQVRRQVLSWMVDQVLIEQAAASQGVSVPAEKVDAEIARLVGTDDIKFQEWLTDNGLTPESFRLQLQRELLGAALQDHIMGSQPPAVEQVHARHILVASESEAMDVLVKLSAGEGFASLAETYSLDRGTFDSGGDLGFFPRGVMPRDIEDVAFSLPAGRLSGIVKTDFGYHIIEVVERDDARQVADELVASWRQHTFVSWLDEQRAAAVVQTLVPLE